MNNSSESRSSLSPERSLLLIRRLKQKGVEFNIFPLSSAQKRLWAITQLDPSSAAYNIPVGVRFQGVLDVNALEYALSTVIKRHEILRTTFKVINGEPIQVISVAESVHLRKIKINECLEEMCETQVHRLAQEESEKPFDLKRGPLLRVTLLELDEQDHVLFMTMHHIISDAWSAGIIVREVTALYDAYIKGYPSLLPELQIQYADFSVWQIDYLDSEAHQKELDYWKLKLVNAPALIELPLDHPRPLLQNYKGMAYSIRLNEEVLTGIQELSSQESATCFMTFLAAFKALFFRYSGQASIVVGTPVAGRTKAETELLIGFFVNTLVLQTPMCGNESFRQLLRKVRGVCLEAYAHQEMPFEKLLEELHPERSLSYSPLFQVMVSHQNKRVEAIQLQGLRLSQIEMDTETSKFELVLTTIERNNDVEVRVKYRSDLFESSTIEQLLRHYEQLLLSIIKNADQCVSQLALLTKEEEQAIRNEHKRSLATRGGPHCCLHELFEARVSEAPNAVALMHGDEELTYKELNQRANHLAQYLQKLGVGPESMVGLLVERSVEMIVGMLGILKAGGAYVPLDPSYPVERLSFMIEDTSIKIILTQSFLLDQLPGKESIRNVCLDDWWNKEYEMVGDEVYADLSPISRVRSENAAYVIYTSGSTGRPKGVVITHNNVTRLFDVTHQRFNFSHEDVWTMFHSYAFDFSVWEIWGALLYGGCLVVVPYWVSRSPADFYELLRQRKVTVLNQTPSAFSLIMAEDEKASIGSISDPLSFLRLIIFGGEALKMDSLKGWIDQHGTEHPRLVNMYGITETTVHVTYILLSEEEINCVNGVNRSRIGVALDDLETYVLDRWLQPAPAKVSGELYVGGKGLARGYHQRSELSAERFIPHQLSEEPGARLYKTGDLVRWLPSGELEYLGRIDHQVKLRGYRIELGEIENALSRYPGVEKSVVMLSHNASTEGQLIAYLIMEIGCECDVSELRLFLKQCLPDYMVPSSYVIVPKLPLLPNGKIDSSALPTLSYCTQSQMTGSRALNRLESLISEVWCEVLKLKELGAHDNFFEKGGDSIKAAIIVNRLQQQLERIIHVVTIFDAPTIEQFAAFLDEHYKQVVELWLVRSAEQDKNLLSIVEKPAQNLPPIIRVKNNANNLPLSFAQERLWFLSQLEPESSFYNCLAAVRLIGLLDVHALERTLSEIVRRHEVLRTSFKMIDEHLVQIVSPELSISLPVTDLSVLSEYERDAEARRLVEEEAHLPFDLAVGPMMRAKLIRMGEDDHLILFMMHHIVSDGWSMNVLIGEIAALYKAFLHGNISPLAELSIQYADYARWQRSWLQGEVWKEHLDYWKAQLRGKLTVLDFNADFERPVTSSNRGGIEIFPLAPSLTEALKEFSRQENETLFMTMLAGFKTLLFLYTGESDIIVGTDTANRNRVETEVLIGFFINLLVLRTDLSGDPTFREVARRVRETTLGAYRYQEMPFEKLVEEIRPDRRLNSAPFFQVIFGMHNVPRNTLELPGLKLSLLEESEWTAKFDLTISVSEHAEGTMVCWKYNQDLFKPTTIQRMALQYATLLANLIARPDARISTQQTISEGERGERAEKKKTREEANAQKFKAIKPTSVNLKKLSNA